MRSLIIIFFMLAFYQDTFSHGNPDKPLTDSLLPFYLTYTYGYIVHFVSELKIYKENNKWYATYVEPKFYVAGAVDGDWTVDLDSNKIRECLKFINKAKTLPRTCEESTSSIHEYTIALGNDTIKIAGECEWGNSNFYGFSTTLFKERFTELEMKRLALIESLNQQLRGRWYFAPLKNKLNEWDSVVLTKSNDHNSECFWEFGNDSSFKSSCNSILDYTYSSKYRWGVEEQDTFLNIRMGIKIKNGEDAIGNHGATFIVKTLNGGELKLIYLSD